MKVLQINGRNPFCSQLKGPAWALPQKLRASWESQSSHSCLHRNSVDFTIFFQWEECWDRGMAYFQFRSPRSLSFNCNFSTQSYKSRDSIDTIDCLGTKWTRILYIHDIVRTYLLRQVLGWRFENSLHRRKPAAPFLAHGRPEHNLLCYNQIISGKLQWLTFRLQGNDQ